MHLAEPRVRRWTKAEYHELAGLGWFHGERVELIGGEIVVMSPQGFPHAACTDKVAEVLRAVFGQDFWVRMQLPLDLGVASEPEPDVSVVAGKRSDYADHPKTALLVVEVSDTTLSYDRGPKASLYAAAGIQEYWIVNLLQRQVEVFRRAAPEASEPHGFRYVDAGIRKVNEAVTPVALPEARITVAELLP